MVPSGYVLWRVSREASLNLGGLCASSVRGRFNQLTEGELKSNQESDSSIVVRDGRTDHTPSQSSGDAGMAKGMGGRMDNRTQHSSRGFVSSSFKTCHAPCSN